jgi:hypothetical protein
METVLHAISKMEEIKNLGAAISLALAYFDYNANSEHRTASWFSFIITAIRFMTIVISTWTATWVASKAWLTAKAIASVAMRFFTTTPKNEKPKIAKIPNEFNRATDITDWLNRMERNCNAMGITTPQYKTEILLDNMDYTERRTLEHVEATDGMDRNATIRELMSRAYGPATQNIIALKRQFFERQQQNDETATQNFLQLQEMAHRMYPGRIRNDFNTDFRQAFTHGLISQEGCWNCGTIGHISQNCREPRRVTQAQNPPQNYQLMPTPQQQTAQAPSRPLPNNAPIPPPYSAPPHPTTNHTVKNHIRVNDTLQHENATPRTIQLTAKGRINGRIVTCLADTGSKRTLVDESA